MEIGNILDINDINGWHSWLANHHQTENEIWLVFYKKASGKPSVSYNDAVMEALRYGWIDSTVKNLDDDRYVQRFSKRKKTSGLSQMNKERIRILILQNKMTKAGLDAIAHVFDPERDNPEVFNIPDDILQPLRADKQAWANFQKLPEDYKRIRIAFIESRRRHGQKQFQTSLRHFIDVTAKNKRVRTTKGIE